MILASCSITLTHQIDISAIYWFYLLQSSTAAAPSKPTAAQATAFINNGALPGNWVLAEPTYTENSTMSLYVVELTQYSDATGAWSEVSLSSSYEAAKIAYNKAQVAQDSVDGIDVGGRNLILGTAQPVQSADSSNGSAYTKAYHLFSDYGTELFINNTTDEFTISYDYEVFGAESQEGHSAYIYNQVNGAQVAKTTVYLTSASETGHASFTAKLNTTQAEHSNRPFTLRFRLRYAVDGAYFIIRNVKLEKGNKATDWTPAPEDIDSSIATAQSTATSAQNAASTAQSAANTAQSTADTALAQSVEYIVGTQTAATGSWTGVTTDSELVAGKTIAYKLPYAGSGNASLNLTLADGTETGAKAVYLNTTRVTTHFGANSVINMTYDGSYWRASSIPNSNNYDRIQYKAILTAESAIPAGRIAVMGESGSLILLSSEPFDVTGPILYVGTAFTANDLDQSNNYIAWGTPFKLANTVSGFSGTAGRPVYIVGTLAGKIFTPTEDVLTTTEPESEDGLSYILLGIMSTTADAVLCADHPIYQYYRGGFKTVQQIAMEARETAETAQSTGESNSLQIGKLAEQNAQIQRLIDQIQLWVSSIANKRAWTEGRDISAYETDETPTLDNYPAADEFWIWPICANNLKCSDTLICGTNNYPAHKYDIVNCTNERAFYIFDQDSTGAYYWREMTEAEYRAKSNQYSAINIEADGIDLRSVLNVAETLVSITSAGVTVTPDKLLCC